MALLKSLWSWIAVIVFVAFVSLVLAPGYGLLRLTLRARNVTGAAFRRANSRYMFAAARAGFRLFCILMRITPKFVHRDSEPLASTIIVSNHQSITDILLLLALLPEVGCADARWVMKNALGKIPFIGHLCRAQGSAFIDREEPTMATLAIGAAAALAHADEASLVLFPEGTRFIPREGGYPDPAGGPNYMHVRPPKLAGFLEMLRQMPTSNILMMITIDWGEDVEAKTISQLGTLIGRTVTVRAVRERAPRVPGTEIAWLNDRWREMERDFARRRYGHLC